MPDDHFQVEKAKVSTADEGILGVVDEESVQEIVMEGYNQEALSAITVNLSNCLRSLTKKNMVIK